MTDAVLWSTAGSLYCYFNYHKFGLCSVFLFVSFLFNAKAFLVDKQLRYHLIARIPGSLYLS